MHQPRIFVQLKCFGQFQYIKYSVLPRKLQGNGLEPLTHFEMCSTCAFSTTTFKCAVKIPRQDLLTANQAVGGHVLYRV